MWSILENVPRALETFVFWCFFRECHIYIYPFGLMGHLRPLFPYWFFIEWSWVHWWTETWLSKISKQADPDSFQMGLRLYEILCVPSKIGVYVSHSPLALPNAKTYWPSKSDVLGTHLSAGPMMWGSDPSFLGENPCNYSGPPLCESSAWVCWSWLC